jgi:hypothetical protein
MLGNEARLFGYPSLKLVTTLTPMFRLTADIKDHRVGYSRTVVLEAISPLVKVVKTRMKMVGWKEEWKKYETQEERRLQEE